MAENSYMSMFADPSAGDVFGSSLTPLTPNNEDSFTLLQPNVTPVSASNFQPSESESTTIITLGESNGPPKQPPSSGPSYTQLGQPNPPYGFHPQFSSQPPQQRFPSYYNSGSLPPGSNPQQQPPPPRMMGPPDPYRQQYPGYPPNAMPNQAAMAPQPGSHSTPSWPQGGNPGFMGQPPVMRPSGFMGPDQSQQQYGQPGFGQPGAPPRPMGYPPHGYAGGNQYPYPPQQQMVRPGMPYQMQPPPGPMRYPGQPGQPMPQQQRMQGMYGQPQRPPVDQQQFGQANQPQKSPEQKNTSSNDPSASPRNNMNGPTPVSPSPLAALSQMGPSESSSHSGKSPESPSPRPPAPSQPPPQQSTASSPLPPQQYSQQQQQQMPQQGQQIRGPPPGQFPPGPPQNGHYPQGQPQQSNQFPPGAQPMPGQYPQGGPPQPGMMGPHGMQRPGAPMPPHGMPQGQPPGQNGMYHGAPQGHQMYPNNPNIVQQRPPGMPVPGAGPVQQPHMANIAQEIHAMKQHIQNYMASNQRTQEGDRKIIELQQRIQAMQTQQHQMQQSGMRMPFAPGLSQPGMGMPPNGMPNQPPMQPNGIPQMRPMEPSVMQRPPMPQPPMQAPPGPNGFPYGAQNGQRFEPPVHSPKPPASQDSSNPDMAASSQESDEEGNKYGTPKKRNRNRSTNSTRNRKRKAPPSADDTEVGEGGVKTPSKSSKSRSRPSQKKPTPSKSNFQFGKKKKKKQGSDDDGDDLDATPPPSPGVVEAEFDGNYVEKRRSGRVTKRTKYVDDVDLDEEDAVDIAAPSKAPVAQAQAAPVEEYLQDENSSHDMPPPKKAFFVEPGDAEPVLVEKIMSHRMGKRPVHKETENGETSDEKVEEYDVEEFYVKFKSYSYLHCAWSTLDELEVLDKRIKQKVTRYKLKKETASFMEENDDEPFNPDYTIVERIIDEKEFPDVEDPSKTKKYFLCKWTALNYDECSWEVEEDAEATKIEEYRKRLNLPPPQLRMRVDRPSRRTWTKMDKGAGYKSGNTLRDYQLEGVNWLLFCWYNHQNCILADEMGLGKTVQSTVFLEHIYRHQIRGPFLVVVPLSTLGNWAREVETWTDMNGIVYHGGSVAREVIREYEFHYRDENGQKIRGFYKFEVFITTYEILLSDLFELKDIEWRALVIDEAHRLKNKNCKLLEGLKMLDVEHTVLLTGTPLQNNVEELFSLLNYLDPERFSNAEAFSRDFGDLKTDEQVTNLQNILKPMMLRRLKEDVEKSIAPKEETIIEVELTNMQKKWYRAILEKNFTFLQKGTNSANVPNLMNTMMELRKCCNHPYLLNGAEESIVDDVATMNRMKPNDPELLTKALVQSSGKLVLIDKLFPKLKEGGHKVLVFSQMVRCLDILEDYLIQKRYLFERIDGRIRGPDRQAAIDRFSREDSDRFVFLLCTRAGGLGINLTAADTVIIFDSDWNPQNDLQAQARCHRIGQDKPVKVYRLITRNSYEREMFDKASLKLGLDKAVLQSSQLNAGKDAFANAQAQLSKSDIEDLLKRGAYGALMDDDAAADQFCTEDIDQILQRRTTTVQLEAGEKGSTFSKASFSATGTRDDIDINDPDFWQKWAKKAEVSTDKDAFENELIIHEPRRRAQVRRYGEDIEEEAAVEGDSDDTYDSEDDEGGKGRRGKRGRKGGKKNELEAVRIGSWQRMECLKLERQLLAWGWGRWSEILKQSKFKRPYTEKDVEIFARTLVHYCCKNYSGSDDKAKPYVYALVQNAFTEDFKARKANLEKLVGKEAVSEPVEETGSRSRKAKRSAKKAESEDNESGETGADMPDWESDPRYDPEKLLDAQFLKHMKRTSINRLVLRMKMLQNLKEEVIMDLGESIMNDTDYKDVPIEMPPVDGNDRPTDWWDDDADKCLLIGTYKHGYEAYAAMRNDEKLCFLTKCGPTSAAQPIDEEKANGSDPDAEEGGDGDDSDADADSDAPKRRGRKKKEAAPTPKAKPGRGRKPASAKRQVTTNGDIVFPSDADLNTRFRRLIMAFEKKRQRAEQLEQKRAQKLDRQMQAERERESKRLEIQQKKWSRREETEFLRVATIFGVERGEDPDSMEWERFREIARLEKKLDKTLTEYYRSFYQMLRKVCGKKLTREEEELASLVEDIPEDRANRCLQRIELLNRVRYVVLQHSKLDERLKLCQPSSDLPTWWIVGQHDKELLEGAAKYGINDTACNIAVDTDFSFADCIKSALSSENKKESKSSKMESILKREPKLEKVLSPANSEKAADVKPAEEPKKEEDHDEETSKLKIDEDDGEKKEEAAEDTKEKEAEGKSGTPEPEKRDESNKRDESAEKDDPMEEKDGKKEVEKEEKSVISPKKEEEEEPKVASSSKQDPEDKEMPGELTVAQLLAKGMYAKGWPSDRVVQARLENVCYCVEHNRWPSKRTQALMYSSIVDEQSLSAPVVNQPSQSMMPNFAENFLDPEFALLAAGGHIPGLNGMEPRRRRGRRPKAEIEAERMAQFHAAQAALLAQQQALMQAAASAKGKQRSHGAEDLRSNRGRDRDRESGSRPPPAHQRSERNDTDNEMDGVLDLTGKGKSSSSTLSPFVPSTSKKESSGKGSKLNQKVDTLLQKRKQETQQLDMSDPNCRIPVINMMDGSILKGDKAPKQKDIQNWLMEHPNYVVDTSAFAFPGMFPDMSALMKGAASSSKGRNEPESPSAEQAFLSGEENVTVINKKTGKKISGRKAPQLKNLAEWLEENKDYDIDESWKELLREQGAIAAKTESSSSKRSKKGAASDPMANAAALFGGSPFGSPFGMPGMSGFPRMPFPFPGMPGFPGLTPAMMGLLPGMSDVAESSKSDAPSTSKKDRNRDRDGDREPSSSKKSKAEKQAKADQSSMESMMQSQLPFIFPQASMFGGMNPFLAQGFPGMPGGFPFSMAGLMNGFPGAEGLEAPSPSGEQEGKSRKSEKERKRRPSSPSEKSEPSSSSSRRKTPVEKPSRVVEESHQSDGDDE